MNTAATKSHNPNRFEKRVAQASTNHNNNYEHNNQEAISKNNYNSVRSKSYQITHKNFLLNY